MELVEDALLAKGSTAAWPKATFSASCFINMTTCWSAF
jgi:hypothetical protein